MKKSELKQLIRQLLKEQLAPMKGDRPTPVGMTLYVKNCKNGGYIPPVPDIFGNAVSNLNSRIIPKALIDNRTPNQSDVGKTIQAEPGGNPTNKSVILKVEPAGTSVTSPDIFNVYTSDNQCVVRTPSGRPPVSPRGMSQRPSRRKR